MELPTSTPERCECSLSTLEILSNLANIHSFALRVCSITQPDVSSLFPPRSLSMRRTDLFPPFRSLLPRFPSEVTTLLPPPTMLVDSSTSISFSLPTTILRRRLSLKGGRVFRCRIRSRSSTRMLLVSSSPSSFASVRPFDSLPVREGRSTETDLVYVSLFVQQVFPSQDSTRWEFELLPPTLRYFQSIRALTTISLSMLRASSSTPMGWVLDLLRFSLRQQRSDFS